MRAGVAMLVQGAGGGGGTDKRYWRIYITATNGSFPSDPYCTIQEVEWRTSVGGADVSSPSTTTYESSHFATRSSAKAVDNNFTGDELAWTSGGGALPQWIAFDLGGDTNIAEVAIWAGSGSSGVTRAPMDFLIEWSPDNATWTTARTVTGATSWASYSELDFSVP